MPASSPPPVLAVLAVHPERVAATRLRVAQYGPALRDAGFDVRTWTFLHDRDLGGWFGGGTIGRAQAVLRGLGRTWRAVRLVRAADVVVVQREAMPLGPPVLERLAARWATLVWDVDDFVWADFSLPTARRVPRWLRATGDKFGRIAAIADEVWAGSEVLAAWCRERNPHVEVVPTVVDVPPSLPAATKDRTVGWIGSQSTSPFIAEVLPAVAAVDPAPEVVLVGADVDLEDVGLRGTLAGWTQAAEDAALARTRVGLYPIDPRHPLADGKCGLKAILFLAHGVPVVVTPTPTNAVIVRDGVDGLHASTPAEWTARVGELLDDDARWEALRRSGYERVRDGYSLAVWAPKVVDRLRALLD